MKKEGQLSKDLPVALRRQFARLQRKLWWVDSIIALSGVMLGLFLSYMVFFVADLTSEMSVGVRLLLFGTAWGLAGEMMLEADHVLEPIMGNTGWMPPPASSGK